MRRLRLLINVLLLVVPLGLLTSGAYRFVRSLFAYLNTDARLAGVLSAEATRALGREVRVRDVKITGNLWSLSAPNTIELRGVYVADEQGVKGAFLRAEKVIVSYNLQQLALTKDLHIPQMNSLTLVGPQATLIRDARGHWNFENLIRRAPATGGRRFTDKVTISNGSLRYADAAFPHPAGVTRRPFVTRLDRVSGVILVRPDQSILFDVGALGDPLLVQDFHATGIANLHPLTVNARILAHRLALSALGARLVPARLVRLDSGLADLDVSALYLPRPGQSPTLLDLKALTVSGNAQLSGLNLYAPRLGEPLQNLNGTAVFTTDSLSGQVRGRYAGTDFSGAGSAFGLIAQILGQQGTPRNIATTPTLNLKATLRNLDFARLLRQPPIASNLNRLPANVRTILARTRATGATAFTFSGTPADPTASLDANLTTLANGRYSLRNVRATVRLAKRQIRAGVQTIYAGGDLIVRGQASLEADRAYAVEAHGRRVELAALGLRIPGPVAGRGDVDVVARGKIGTVPSANAQVQLSNVKLNTATFRTVYLQADTVGQILVLRSLRAEDPKGVLSAQGTLAANLRDPKQSRIALAVSGDEINLGAVARALPNWAKLTAPLQAALAATSGNRADPGTPTGAKGLRGGLAITGTGYVRAKVGGTLGSPLATGQVSAYAVGADRVSADKISANFDLTPRALVINSGVIRRYPGLVRVAGLLTNPLKPTRSLSLTVGLERADLPDLLELAGVSTGNNLILGAVSTNDILLEGRPNALRIRRPFTASLQDVSVNGLPIHNAFARLTYDQTQGVLVSAANAEIAGGTLKASGKAKPGGVVDLTATGTGLDLETLAGALPQIGANRPMLPDATGTLGFSAHLAGTTRNLRASVALTGRNIGLENARLGDVRGTANYAGNRVTLGELVLSSPAAPPGTVPPLLVPGAAPSLANVLSLNRLSYDVKTKEIAGTARLDSLSTTRVREILAGSTFSATDAGKSALSFLSRISGSLSASVTLSGTASDPRADVTWNGNNLRVGNELIRTLTGSARITKESVISPSPAMPTRTARIESYLAGAEAPNAVIVANRLNVRYGGAISADVDAYNVNLSLVQGLFPQSASALQSAVTSAAKGTGLEAAPGKTPPVDPALAPAALPAALSLSGVAENIGLVASGTTESPVVDLSATLKNVGVTLPAGVAGMGGSGAPLTVDRIILDHARAEQGQLTIDGISVTKYDPNDPQAAPYVADASGTIHGFSWQPPFIPPSSALNLQARIPMQSLQMLSAFSPGTTAPPTDPLTSAKPGPISTKGKPLTAVGATFGNHNPLRDTKGTFAAQVTITGTRARPNVQGSVDVAASKVRVAGFHTGLKDVAASFGFEGERLTVRSFAATPQVYDSRGDEALKGTGDPLQLAGSIALGLGDPNLSAPPAPGLTLYDARLVFDEAPLPVFNAGNAKGVALVNLKLGGEVLRGPELSGSVTVTDTQASLPAGLNGSGSPGTPLANPPRFNNVAINFGPNVRLANTPLLANTALNAQLDSNEANYVTINGDLNAPRLEGRLTINKGRFTLPTARFDIVPPALISLRYPVDAEGLPGTPTLGLNVNLKAQTFLTATSRLGVRKRYRVTVAANGPLTGLTTDPTTGRSRFALNFTTDPNDLASSQEELQSRLAGALVSADTFTQLQRNPGQAFAGLLTNVFTSSVLPGVFDQLASSMHFEEFVVNYDPVQRLTLTVSRQIAGPLYVTYLRSLSGTQEIYDLKASLRFRDRYQVSYDIDEQHTQRVLLEGVFHY